MTSAFSKFRTQKALSSQTTLSTFTPCSDLSKQRTTHLTCQSGSVTLRDLFPRPSLWDCEVKASIMISPGHRRFNSTRTCPFAELIWMRTDQWLLSQLSRSTSGKSLLKNRPDDLLFCTTCTRLKSWSSTSRRAVSCGKLELNLFDLINVGVLILSGDNLRLEPMSGDLKPNSHCNIKMTLVADRYPTNFEGEICCSIDWEDKAEEAKSVATNTNVPETSEYLFLRLKKRSKIVSLKSLSRL